MGLFQQPSFRLRTWVGGFAVVSDYMGVPIRSFPIPITGTGMKAIGTLFAGLLLAGLCWPQPASAQGVPPGSYLRSCGNAYLQGDTLIATCRRMDGYPRQTSLPAVQRCVGDIGNANGNLTCNYARGAAPPPLLW